ncbi:hypothetical protein [uncultured Ruegeria sp.]|uniref:hypothetical protein n=1 Tax=uncultured Ruegeria sp. TaxID=259304 RepID=UPI00260DB565|nr:hypothetical protein [uncultured Ruegeria sp.]
MKLNDFEESIIHDFIMGETDAIPEEYNEILTKAELGVQITERIDFEVDARRLGLESGPSPAFTIAPKGIALLIFAQNAELAREVLVAFKKSVFSTLTLRVERSWRCYIHCSDRIIEKTCEEDKESTEACCIELRDSC